MPRKKAAKPKPVEALVEPEEGAGTPRARLGGQEFEDQKALDVQAEAEEHLRRRRSEARTD